MDQRRFNLVDAMILVAGVAVAGALSRSWFRSPEPSSPWALLFGNTPEPAMGLHRFVQTYESLAAVWLVALLLAVLGMQLRPPRPRWSRFWRRPGAAATLAASLMLALGVAGWGIALALECQGWGDLNHAALGAWLVGPPGAAIAATWLWAKATRRWYPERSFLDRAGRAMGWSWIGLLVLSAGTKTATGLERSFRDAELVRSNRPPTPAQAQAAEASRLAHAGQMRQYYRDQREYLEWLRQSHDAEQVDDLLDERLQALETERMSFETTEHARVRSGSRGVGPTPTVPDPPKLPSPTTPPGG